MSVQLAKIVVPSCVHLYIYFFYCATLEFNILLVDYPVWRMMHTHKKPVLFPLGHKGFILLLSAAQSGHGLDGNQTSVHSDPSF